MGSGLFGLFVGTKRKRGEGKMGRLGEREQLGVFLLHLEKRLLGGRREEVEPSIDLLFVHLDHFFGGRRASR